MLAKEQTNQLNATFNTHKKHGTISNVLSIGRIAYKQNTTILPIPCSKTGYLR
jgi:hypothetical protein